VSGHFLIFGQRDWHAIPSEQISRQYSNRHSCPLELSTYLQPGFGFIGLRGFFAMVSPPFNLVLR
jgi:hypothetical protein